MFPSAIFWALEEHPLVVSWAIDLLVRFMLFILLIPCWQLLFSLRRQSSAMLLRQVQSSQRACPHPGGEMRHWLVRMACALSSGRSCWSRFKSQLFPVMLICASGWVFMCLSINLLSCSSVTTWVSGLKAGILNRLIAICLVGIGLIEFRKVLFVNFCHIVLCCRSVISYHEQVREGLALSAGVMIFL